MKILEQLLVKRISSKILHSGTRESVHNLLKFTFIDLIQNQF